MTIPNGSGFLTAIEPNNTFRGLKLDTNYFITSSHQKYRQSIALKNRSIDGAELKNRAVCGNVTFEYREIGEASKEVRFNFEKQFDAKKSKECEIDETTRSYNLRKKPFVWSGCDLSVNSIDIKSIKGGNLSELQPYSTQIDIPTMKTYEKIILEVIHKGAKKYFACPIGVHFAGGQIAQCSLKHEYTKNISKVEDVNGIGISSGTVVLAYENNRVAKVNNNPKALGIVTDFWVSEDDITIVIENLKMSEDVPLPKSTRKEAR